MSEIYFSPKKIEPKSPSSLIIELLLAQEDNGQPCLDDITIDKNGKLHPIFNQNTPLELRISLLQSFGHFLANHSVPED